MPEASRLLMNLRDGNNADKGYRPTPVAALTLDKLIEWIKLQNLDDYTTKSLIEMAARYPNAALPAFRKNFNLMLHRVRMQREKEQTGELDVENKTNQQETSQESRQEGSSQEKGTSQQRAEIV